MDSKESQKVDHLVKSPLNFFKDSLGNLTLVEWAPETDNNGVGVIVVSVTVTEVAVVVYLHAFTQGLVV